MKNVDYYIGLMDELEEEFSSTVKMFEYIDEMVLPRWSLPAEFSSVVKDVMAVVDTAPSDAINSGAIALSGSTPIFNVTPYMPNIAEYDRAQGLEDNITDHFKRSNKRGDGSLMYDIAESSLKYNTICVRVDDLAHILPKNRSSWNPLQKNAWAGGRFIYEAVNPKVARYLYSRMGLTLVGYTEEYKVDDIIRYWSLYENNNTDEGKKIASALAKLRSDVEEKQKDAALKAMKFSQTYVIDYDKLCIWGSLTENGNEVSQDKYVFADQENPYGFIPWSVRVAGSRLEKNQEYRVNPLLAPLYWSKSWDKLNLAKSVIFSEPFRRARSPRMATMTNSGEAPNIDYENGNDINLRTGESVQGLQPIDISEGAMAIVGQLEAAENRTTGASMIGDTTKIGSDTPFATFSAMVKVALSRLDKQRQIMADSCVDIACNMLWWVDKTNVPLTSYATENKQLKSGSVRPMGQMIETASQDYDLNNLGITAKVQPMTPTDRMEQLNMAVILSKQLNVPTSYLLEEMGYENVGMMYELWTREFLKNAEVQAQAQAMMQQATLQVQQQAQQQAQQAQQPQGQPMGAGQGISNTSFGALGNSPGVNPAVGGMSPTQGAPTMTREMITGRNRMQGG
jgi:hypothetical protein